MQTETVVLTASDGHELDAFVAHPEGDAKGAVIVIQEIFGLTGHIRGMTEKFAAEGYLAIAPAMYDRVAKNIVLDYSDFEAARESMGKLDRDTAVLDMQAAAEFGRSAGKVGIVGFCWGGAMADLAACNGLVEAGVSYYGRMTIEWLDQHPTCPMVYHYGEVDELIPMQTIETIQRKRKGEVYVWGGADHGFCCEDRPSFHKQAYRDSMNITLAFFSTHL